MILIVKFFAATFGFFGIIFGAFGAHRLKRILAPEVLHSFETGVKYQLIHAVVLLILGFHFEFVDFTERMIASSIIIGVILFSFSKAIQYINETISSIGIIPNGKNNLMEGSKSGSYFSYVAVVGMLLLFLCESGEFFSRK